VGYEENQLMIRYNITQKTHTEITKLDYNSNFQVLTLNSINMKMQDGLCNIKDGVPVPGARLP